MTFSPTSLGGSYLIETTPHQDERGWFLRYFCKKEFEQIGHSKEWVQMNHSCTHEKGALRGMHYQVSPNREIKLVKCIAGSVYDVIIDLRKNSPTFLKWFGTELSSGNRKMLYIPEGFAHGFQCLETGCELLYLHTGVYETASERGIRYSDPMIGIQWPLTIAVLSPRDRQHLLLTSNFEGA